MNTQNADFTLDQDIYTASHPPIIVSRHNANALKAEELHNFMSSVATTGHLGIAPVYGSKCALSVVAFASSTHVIIIHFPGQRKEGRHRGASAKRPALDLLERVVLRSPYPKYAFHMDNVALSLMFDLNLPIVHAVDLLDLQKSDRQSFDAILVALGGENYHNQLRRDNVMALFREEEGSQTLEKHTALQAWSACCAVMLDHMASESDPPKISTLNFNKTRLTILAKINRHAHRLTSLKPLITHNDVKAEFSYKKGKIQDSDQNVEHTDVKTMEILAPDRTGLPKTTRGRVTKVNGRAATIAIQGHLSAQAPLKVTTIGRDEPTQAEEAKVMIVLAALQRSSAILNHPFTQALWFPRPVTSWTTCPSFSHKATINFPSPRPLNDSQLRAVDLILSNRDADRVTVIQGPPGTGKTTVIAATVTSITASTDRKRTLWLVAQSNVAVKNIAEKLASIKFLEFKILVSKDFHYDWHEHLYTLIEPNLIRSNEFPTNIVGMKRLLLDSRIILCTLSMLSNDRISTIVHIVPVETIIFDEASQINIGGYLPVIHRFASSLRKMVFIGDDKQLPPFGQSDIPDLESVFEKQHLRRKMHFLDTQYRMPTPIGDFISEHVYNRKLKTIHQISSKTCCRFVNVSSGQEIQRSKSWVNVKEVQAVVNIAKILQGRKKQFRVITPYDAQRSAIEEALKADKLSWEDKCFNVDSFQASN
ncbi:P-loop containing nucleoside triphosphate hydrolase protein [Armillaria gallica]|uniref:P-loop containing nucleoside triphosphate hydrolase protein n=1 Tax=Armillaria gallica TaxID=47427 RepID=A0A2H3EB49_ARMGA|nr:P-loop containing nucleoside triphosphate hydrolase protein [Armillaria gallica]